MVGRLFILAAFATLLAAAPAVAKKVPVDLELAFVVDLSGSIDDAEVRLQREGYSDALAHPRVLNAISGGFLRSIAVAYIEFAAEDCETLSVPWTLIGGRPAAAEFGRRVVERPRWFCVGGNAIGDAIAFATKSIEDNVFEGTRLVIDVSGDGTNTLGRSVTRARDAAVARNMTVNGLVIDRPDIPELYEYFKEFVIGGPGAFAIRADDRKTFAAAILKKLLAEIAARPPAGAAPQQARRTGAIGRR
ncbi:MAG: DUF1194 domain-containing protein [Alphaproteobacteria bacterium]|jgi:hypothetical protein|nr:DUF1194 domain-containing protein [Alphaproteobacteria bacterium]